MYTCVYTCIERRYLHKYIYMNTCIYMYACVYTCIERREASSGTRAAAYYLLPPLDETREQRSCGRNEPEGKSATPNYQKMAGLL